MPLLLKLDAFEEQPGFWSVSLSAGIFLSSATFSANVLPTCGFGHDGLVGAVSLVEIGVVQLAPGLANAESALRLKGAGVNEVFG